MRRCWAIGVTLSSMALMGASGCVCDVFPEFCNDQFGALGLPTVQNDGPPGGPISTNLPPDPDELVRALSEFGGASFRERFQNGVPFFEVLDADGNSLGIVVDGFGDRAFFTGDEVFDDGTRAADVSNGVPTGDDDGDDNDADDGNQDDGNQDDGQVITEPGDDGVQDTSDGDDGQDNDGDAGDTDDADDDDDDAPSGQVVVEKTVDSPEDLAGEDGEDSDDSDDCDPLSYLIFSCDFDVPDGGTVQIEIESDEEDSRPNVLFSNGSNAEFLCGGGSSSTIDRVTVDPADAGSYFVAISDAGTVASSYTIKITIFDE